jgi:tetratricopeptide (TPR) repeat protein
MSEFTKSQHFAPIASSESEEARLEIALHDPDRLLTDSLRVDERRRRVRRLVRVTLFVGGILMGTTLIAVLAGWLALAEPPDSARQGDLSGTKPARAARSQPGDEDARIERAEELAAQGWQLWQEQKMRDAATVFEQAVELDAENANIWNGLGWARFGGGDSEAAVEAFEKAVELEPSHPAALNGLGQVYFNWADLEKAKKYLAKAAPKAPAAYYSLARAHLLTGDYEKALTWTRKALRQQPGDETLKAMVAAARKKELPDELRKQIEPAGKPESPSAVQAAATGWQQFNQGKYRSAERNFRRALAKDPENLAAMNGLAFILLNSGKSAEAKQYFEKCLKLEPDAAGPMNGLARCLKEEGKVDEAIAVWEKMYGKHPGPNAAAAGLAQAYLEQKEYAKALPYFEELVKAAPDNEEFRNGLDAAKRGAEKGASVSDANL